MIVPPFLLSMLGYIVITFPFVCSYVCLFVRSFVFPSQGQSFCVKVYKTSYFEDPLTDFIHIWHDGRYRSKVFICTIPTTGVTLGSRIFIKRSVFIAPACSRVRYRRPIFRPSVRPSVRLSTFMSTFDIYVKVSILINYKTKQPSNLA